VVSAIRIYVEGGGDSGDTKAIFRRGFGEFLRDLRTLARQHKIEWAIVPCGGRHQTFDNFQIAIRTHRDAFNVLLVDAEGPVTDPPWEHLHKRDRWRRPEGITDDQCHLMVQSMEAWIAADIEALQQYYGQNFNPNPIPRNPDIEGVDRQRIADALAEATRQTRKGRYHKINHAAELLERLNVARVRASAPHCDRLFTTLAAKMDDQL
jgi:hypothetical protein